VILISPLLSFIQDYDLHCTLDIALLFIPQNSLITIKFQAQISNNHVIYM